MARFPYYEKNVGALGRLIAQASVDNDLLARLKKDPISYLTDIGLPEQTTQLIRFEVVEKRNNPKAVAIPYRLNAEKLHQADTTYLSGLSNMFASN